MIFGGLAVITILNGGRPMALRHRLSSVLPLSDVVLYNYYTINRKFPTLQELFNLWDLRFARCKRIRAGTTNTNIAGSIPGELIIAASAYDAI